MQSGISLAVLNPMMDHWLLVGGHSSIFSVQAKPDGITAVGQKHLECGSGRGVAGFGKVSLRPHRGEQHPENSGNLTTGSQEQYLAHTDSLAQRAANQGPDGNETDPPVS